MIISQNSKLQNPELEAEIYYLTHEEGGRYNPVYSGYRGQLYYNNQNWDAPQEFIDKEVCYMGETVKVYLQTLSPHFHIGQFFKGQIFEIREGSIIVGKGQITKVIRPDFNYWDFESFQSQLPENYKPFDFKSINKTMIDIKSLMDKMKQIESIKFAKKTSGNNQRLIVECQLKNKNSALRPFADELYKNWNDLFPLKDSFFKIKTYWYEDSFELELFFAICDHNIYITGSMIVSTR